MSRIGVTSYRSSIGLFVLALAGCQGSSTRVAPAPVPTATAPSNENAAGEGSPVKSEQVDDQTRERELAAALAVLEAQTDPGWLTVTDIADGAEGGWATGDFDEERNRLVIDTENVTGFAVDMSRVPVDWGKLVVLRLDGRNSELRKRDAAVYQFVIDAEGRWVVKE